MDVRSVALDNIDRAAAQLNHAAARIARISDPTDAVDLSAAMVAILEARTSLQADFAVLRAAVEMDKQIIDVIA